MSRKITQRPTRKATVDWVWQWKWPILGIAAALGFLATTPLIWPGGWGIGEGELATTTIARELIDAQGNPIKDAQGNPQTETLKVTINAPGKSLWDGLSLLGILGVPLILFIMGTRFQKSQQEQADKEAREEVLQLYFDRVSALLIDKNLMAIAAQGEDAVPQQKASLEAALDVIRARTLSILRRFEDDIERKSSLIRFLAEADIVSNLKLNLEGANLTKANLAGVNLQRGNLNRINLGHANLERARFLESELIGAILQGACLERAKFQKATLLGANLQGANLRKADFYGVDLIKTNLEEADLTGTHLPEADLGGANLKGANLINANLTDTNLKNIRFDEHTLWPNKDVVAEARNIPNKLKQQLGLIPEPSQEQSPDKQQPTPPQ